MGILEDYGDLLGKRRQLMPPGTDPIVGPYSAQGMMDAKMQAARSGGTPSFGTGSSGFPPVKFDFKPDPPAPVGKIQDRLFDASRFNDVPDEPKVAGFDASRFDDVPAPKFAAAAPLPPPRPVGVGGETPVPGPRPAGLLANVPLPPQRPTGMPTPTPPPSLVADAPPQPPPSGPGGGGGGSPAMPVTPPPIAPPPSPAADLGQSFGSNLNFGNGSDDLAFAGGGGGIDLGAGESGGGGDGGGFGSLGGILGSVGKALGGGGGAPQAQAPPVPQAKPAQLQPLSGDPGAAKRTQGAQQIMNGILADPSLIDPRKRQGLLA
jgi:hypothetical protein